MTAEQERFINQIPEEHKGVVMGKSITGDVFLQTDGSLVYRLKPCGKTVFGTMASTLFPLEMKVDGLRKITRRANKKIAHATFRAYESQTFALNFEKYL